MGQNEEMAWLEQLKYWEDRREILKIEKQYWEIKRGLVRSERNTTNVNERRV